VRSATTIEAAALLLSRSRVQGVRLLSTLALAGWVLLACGVPPVEVGNAPANNDCLREVTLEELPAALRRCDASVQAFPTDPRPLSERSVLHSLGGDQAAACRDIKQAAQLLRQQGNRADDAQLAIDIRIRLEGCQEKAPLPRPGLTSARSAASPSPAAPGAARPSDGLPVAA
jgi:hypothetical protein